MQSSFRSAALADRPNLNKGNVARQAVDIKSLGRSFV